MPAKGSGEKKDASTLAFEVPNPGHFSVIQPEDRDLEDSDPDTDGAIVGDVEEAKLLVKSRLRTHVPTPAELKQAQELIKKQAHEVSEIDQELNKATVVFQKRVDAVKMIFSDRLEECHRQYLETRAAIEQNQQEEQTRLTNEQETTLTALRTAREKAQTLLDYERAFAAPIRRIPQEIIVEIFHRCDTKEGPSRNLALVCRGWKVLLCDTPSLWYELSANFVGSDYVVEEARRLQRRVELSRSTLLDVTLSTSDYSKRRSRQDLFDIIASTNVTRWRSLSLVHLAKISRAVTIASFTAPVQFGQFSSLRTLHLRYWSDKGDPFTSIGKSIVQSPPFITTLEAICHIPDVYGTAQVFRSVKKVSGDESGIAKLKMSDPLEELKVMFSLGANMEGLPPLPPYSEFYQLGRSHLNKLNTSAVRHLVVENWDDDDTAVPDVVQLPEVTTLEFGSASLTNIRGILAPKLQTLILEGEIHRHTKSKYGEPIAALFKTVPNLVFVKPTTLSIFVSMTIGALVLVLDTWLQLQHLTLIFDDFDTRSAFCSGLIRKKDPLLPDLVSLQIESRGSKFKQNVDDWEDTVKIIFKRRSNLPLRIIKWRCKTSPWERTFPWKQMTSDDRR